jgi:hypothetical protein
MNNNTPEEYVYYAYSTPEQRERGLNALRECLIRDGYIKISEEIEFTEIPNQDNNEVQND